MSTGLTPRERSLRRKWIYGLLMIVLIVVLFALGVPATLGTKDVKGQPDRPGQPGGYLARYRDAHGLSQTELGQIDPTSETIRLATLGMRGIAGTLLWSKANEYQMKKDWTRLRATLDQISKLQPHSVQVWKYQAWNLSYNVSVAFDDYHDKFYWVIEGLKFMLDGVHANDREPRLYWDMAWFLSNKIGRDDAAKYYRRLFREKPDAQGNDSPDNVISYGERFTPPTGVAGDKSDNWQVGKAWFLAAESKINPPRYPVRGMAPVIFYSDAPTCQFYYADALEKDGTFGQYARRAWKQAEDEWRTFGERFVDTSWDVPVQLNRKEEIYDAILEMTDRLDGLAPGVREKIEKDKRSKLAPEERTAWDNYRADIVKYKNEMRNRKGGNDGKLLPQPSLDKELRYKAGARPTEIARLAPPAHGHEADKLAKQIEHEEEVLRMITIERGHVNFEFWRTRAKAEQTGACMAAREAIHNADKAFAKGDLVRAEPEYEKGLAGWRKVLDDAEFHSLIDDPALGGDLVDVIRRYQKCLDQDDRDLPDPFVLQDIVDKWGDRQGDPLGSIVTKKSKKPPAADPKTPPPRSSAEKM